MKQSKAGTLQGRAAIHGRPRGGRCCSWTTAGGTSGAIQSARIRTGGALLLLRCCCRSPPGSIRRAALLLIFPRRGALLLTGALLLFRIPAIRARPATPARHAPQDATPSGLLLSRVARHTCARPAASASASRATRDAHSCTPSRHTPSRPRITHALRPRHTPARAGVPVRPSACARRYCARDAPPLRALRAQDLVSFSNFFMDFIHQDVLDNHPHACACADYSNKKTGSRFLIICCLLLLMKSYFIPISFSRSRKKTHPNIPFTKTYCGSDMNAYAPPLAFKSEPGLDAFFLSEELSDGRSSEEIRSM